MNTSTYVKCTCIYVSLLSIFTLSHYLMNSYSPSGGVVSSVG